MSHSIFVRYWIRAISKHLQAPIIKDFIQLNLYLHIHTKKHIYFRCRLDTETDVNVMLTSVYKKLFHVYSFTLLGSIQADWNIQNSIGMHVIGSCVLYHHTHNKTTQAQSFNVTDIEGSVVPNCTDTHIKLVLTSEKLDKKIPSSAKLVISQASRSDSYTINKKTQGNYWPTNHQTTTTRHRQPCNCHTKGHLISLNPDCFTGLGELQG